MKTPRLNPPAELFPELPAQGKPKAVRRPSLSDVAHPNAKSAASPTQAALTPLAAPPAESAPIVTPLEKVPADFDEEPPAPLPPPKKIKRERKSWKKRTWWSWLWLCTQAACLFGLIISAGVGYFLYEKALVYAARAETYNLKKLDDISVTSTFYDVHGEELGRIFTEDRILLKPEDIPDVLKHAVLSAEDRRFYEHGAIDYKGIARALWQDVVQRKRVMQGASTIEQQVAKHLIGNFARSLDRKLTEAFVAMRLERSLTKEQILNYYMNRVYFGKGFFGVGAAARGYFGKDVKDLNIAECALLAGIIRAPTTSSPRVDPIRAKIRRDLTLKQMLEEGYISQEEFKTALKTPIHTVPSKPAGLQSYVMGAAMKELEQILSIEGVDEMPQGLTVHTNIDLALQHQIEQMVDAKLTELEAAPPGAGTPVGARPQLQSSVILAEPDTGRVHVYIGGRDFAKSQYDHASQAKRENGAVLQPVLYGIAFDRLHLSPASMINASYIDPTTAVKDDEVSLGDPNVDLSKRFLAVQDALALGNRAAATRVGLKLGGPEVSAWLHRAGLPQAGISSDKPNTFLPDPMSLADVVHLYEILANRGAPKRLKLVRSIQSRSGEVLYDDSVASATGTVLPPVVAEQTTLTLARAFRSSPFLDTVKYAVPGPIAAVAGHSEGYRDLWFAGYNPNWIGGIWIGYDDSKPVASKEKAELVAPQLWAQAVQAAQTVYPPAGQDNFPVPGELTKVEINRSTGALSGLPGLAPQPGDIFVYLRKDQIAQIGASNVSPQQRMANPRNWSDWLSSMFHQSDETESAPDPFLMDDKRGANIPTLAQYKMPGLRGDIISADGVVFATTSASKNLVLGWPATDQATEDADVVSWMRDHIVQLETVLTQTGADNKPIPFQTGITDVELKNGFDYRRFQPYTVLENLSPDQEKKIEDAGLLGKGFSLQTIPLRSYPKSMELAHLLGHLTGEQKRNRGKYQGGDIIYDRYRGANGLEKVFNDDLTGTDGAFAVSTTPDGYARSGAVVTPATAGHTIRLTIDSKIQDAAEYAITQRMLRDSTTSSGFRQVTDPRHQGAVLVEDVKTGDIVTFVSNPSYDPNLFVPNISQDNWKTLNEDAATPLLCRPTQAQYPPGSTFKMITSLAAMRAGVFDPNFVVHCTGTLDVAGLIFKFPTEKDRDPDYEEGFKNSFNTYFMTLGLKVGRDILLDTARSFGYGSLSQIDLPDEKPGLLPDPEFTRRVHGREFGPGDLANTSIGQGDVLVTPIQMLGLVTAIADGGTIYKPRLVQSVEDGNGNILKAIPSEVARSIQLDDKYMPNLKKAMIAVVEDGSATRIHRDDMKIAAKTGTAQVGSKTAPRQIAWLAGYLPADDPKYSFVVMIEGRPEDNIGFKEDEGLLGGRDCGQVVKTLFDVVYPPAVKAKKKSGDKTAAAIKSEAADEDKTTDAPPLETNTAPAADTPAAATKSPADKDIH